MFVVDQALLADKPMFSEYVGGTGMHERILLIAGAMGVMLVVQLVGTALGGARTYLLGRVGQRFIYDLRNDLYDRLQAHALPFFHRRRTGDLIARAMGDVDTLEQVALRGTDEVVTNLLQFVGVAGVILWLNWKVGLLTLLPMVGVAAMVHLFNRRVRGLYRRVRDRLGDVSDKLQESITGIYIIKAFGREAHESEQFAKRNREYYDTSLRGDGPVAVLPGRAQRGLSFQHRHDRRRGVFHSARQLHRGRPAGVSRLLVATVFAGAFTGAHQ